MSSGALRAALPGVVRAFVFLFAFLSITTVAPTLPSIALAQDAPAVASGAAPAAPPSSATTGAPTGQPKPFEFILGSVNFFLLAFFVYYILVLRPSQLKQEEHAKFLKALKKDDEVVTGGGLIGRVQAVQKEFISVELAPNLKVRVRPDQVFSAQPAQQTAADKSASAGAEKTRKAK